MKTNKLYFENEDANICYPLQYHLERAKEEGLKEIELFEAIPSTEKDYIWCSELETVGNKSECNKNCLLLRLYSGILELFLPYLGRLS